MAIRVFEPTFGQPQLFHQPQEAFRLSGSGDGLEVTPAPIGHVAFQDVRALSIYQVRERGADKICLMVFSRPRTRPFVVDIGSIDYANFQGLADISSGLEKFRRLVLFLGEKAAGDVLVDAATDAFLRTGQAVLIQKLEREPIVLSSAFMSRLAQEDASVQPPTPQAVAPQAAAPQAVAPQAAAPQAVAPQAAVPPSPTQAAPAGVPRTPPRPRPTTSPVATSTADDANSGLRKLSMTLLALGAFGSVFAPWAQSNYGPDVKVSGLALSSLVYVTLLAAAGIAVLLLVTKKENMFGVRSIVPLLTIPGLLSAFFAKLAADEAVQQRVSASWSGLSQEEAIDRLRQSMTGMKVSSGAPDDVVMSYGWYAALLAFSLIQVIALGIRKE